MNSLGLYPQSWYRARNRKEKKKQKLKRRVHRRDLFKMNLGAGDPGPWEQGRKEGLGPCIKEGKKARWSSRRQQAQ